MGYLAEACLPASALSHYRSSTARHGTVRHGPSHIPIFIITLCGVVQFNKWLLNVHCSHIHKGNIIVSSNKNSNLTYTKRMNALSKAKKTPYCYTNWNTWIKQWTRNCSALMAPKNWRRHRRPISIHLKCTGLPLTNIQAKFFPCISMCCGWNLDFKKFSYHRFSIGASVAGFACAELSLAICV